MADQPNINAALFDASSRDIAALIIGGLFDDDGIQQIVDACAARRKIVGYQILPGTHVRVHTSVKPRYLADATGVVVGHADRGDRIEVRMDTHWHSRVSGRIWRMSPGSFSAIEAEDES